MYTFVVDIPYCSTVERAITFNFNSTRFANHIRWLNFAFQRQLIFSSFIFTLAIFWDDAMKRTMVLFALDWSTHTHTHTYIDYYKKTIKPRDKSR